MAAHLGRVMNVESLEQPADNESTHVLQQSAEAVASYIELSTRSDAAVGYSSLFANHDEMHTEVIVKNNTQLTTTNTVEANYLTLLTDELQNNPDHSDGYFEPVADAYCDILDDTSGSEDKYEAIASHQNVLSAAELVNRLSSTHRSSDVNVWFHSTGPEQITYDNDNRACITAYDNHVDVVTYDNSCGMHSGIHPRVSIKIIVFYSFVQTIVK